MAHILPIFDQSRIWRPFTEKLNLCPRYARRPPHCDLSRFQFFKNIYYKEYCDALQCYLSTHYVLENSWSAWIIEKILLTNERNQRGGPIEKLYILKYAFLSEIEFLEFTAQFLSYWSENFFLCKTSLWLKTEFFFVHIPKTFF